MRKFNVALGLASLSIAALIIFARFIVKQMTGNPFFQTPEPDPTLDKVTKAAKELEDAAENAIDGNRELTDIKKQKRFELEVLLKSLGNYVENRANEKENRDRGEEIIFSAGMNVRKQGGGILRKFMVLNSAYAGVVLLRTGSVGSRASYVWEYSLDGKVWIYAKTTGGIQTTIEGLEPGTRYWFRVAGVIGDTQLPFEGPVNTIVT